MSTKETAQEQHTVNSTVQRARIDRIAKRRKTTRAKLIARGLQGVLQEGAAAAH